MANLDGVDPRLLEAYNQLSQVCNITITSGFRSVEEQADLVRRFQAGEPGIFMPAAPGSSPHNHGRALDVEGDLGCAHANAPRFGAHFPLGSKDPVHMELAGGSADHEPMIMHDQHGHEVAPPKPENHLPTVLAAVQSALSGGNSLSSPDSSVESLGAALGAKPAPPTPEPAPVGAGAPGQPGSIEGNGIFEMILNGVGAPITPENMRLLEAWARAEGMPASSNNPLATTEGNTPGVVGQHNSIGVRLYDSPQSGAQAIVKTLLNGRYNHIIDAMRANDLAGAAIGIENSPWGTGGLVRKILGV